MTRTKIKYTLRAVGCFMAVAALLVPLEAFLISLLFADDIEGRVAAYVLSFGHTSAFWWVAVYLLGVLLLTGAAYLQGVDRQKICERK